MCIELWTSSGKAVATGDNKRLTVDGKKNLEKIPGKALRRRVCEQ
jgi:hypothetical protein